MKIRTYSYNYKQLYTTIYNYLHLPIYNDLLRSATLTSNTLLLSGSASVTANASNLPITSSTIGEGPTTKGKGSVNGQLPELHEEHLLEAPFFL